MSKVVLWFGCLVALLAGIGYIWFSRPGLLVSVVVISLPIVLAVWVSVASGQERGI